jgi:hypothetical protein
MIRQLEPDAPDAGRDVGKPERRHAHGPVVDEDARAARP